jgi:hypothetical protein
MFKYLILLSFGFICLPSEHASGQALYNVTRSEILEYNNLKELYLDKLQLSNIESALSLIEKFLKEDDLSVIYKEPAIAKNIKASLKIIEDPKNTLFEIVAVNSITDKRIVFTVNAYLYFEKVHVQLYKGSFKIGFEVQQQKVIFPVYHPDYITKKYPHINFQLNKALSEPYGSNMPKADLYVANFISYVKSRYLGFNAPVKKLDYIISDGYFNSLEYFGVENYFNVSKYLGDNNTILDVTAKGFYKHELIHYIFSAYKMKKFLREGLATLFSGGKGRFESIPVTEWDAIRKGISADEKYRSVFDNADSLFDGAYSHEMYFTSAVLLYKYYLKLGDKMFFNRLFEKLVLLDDREVLVLVKKELGIARLSTYLEGIDDNTWIAVKATFDKFLK